MVDPLGQDLRRTAHRIGLQTAGLLMACLVVVGVVIVGVVVHSEEQQLTTTLQSALAVAGPGRDHDRDGDTDHDGDLAGPRGGTHTAFLGDGRLTTSPGSPTGLPDTTALSLVAQRGGTDRRQVETSDGPYEVLTAARDGGVAQAAASLADLQEDRERVLGALVVAGSAGLVLSAFVGALLGRRAVAPLARALELQRRFVADAGHELRTPLTLLSTRAQLLARRVTDDTGPAQTDLVRRDAAGIVRDAAGLTAILEELLTAADVRAPVPQDPVDLAATVADAVASSQAAAQEAGVTVLLHPVPAPVVVLGAATALGRAVTALLDNAVEHARRTVEVRVAPRGHEVVVEVSDDGAGIPSDVLPQMFARSTSGTRPDGPGVRRHFGLGLALVSEVAVRHGGSVTAENAVPGPGAVLRLRLPRPRR